MPQDPTTLDVKLRNANGRVHTRDSTQAQLHRSANGILQPELPRYGLASDGTSWYKKAREMREQPTIALARELCKAPIVSAEWSVNSTKDAPEGAKDETAKMLMSIRDYYLENAIAGCIDFGWQAFEKVWTLNKDTEQVVIDKLKPLIPEITTLLVKRKTGEYLGLKQDQNIVNAGLVNKMVDGWLVTGTAFLDRKDTLLSNIQVEGTDWYGRPLLRNVEKAYDAWCSVQNAADRYDRKVAGAHWVIQYPIGYSDLNGVETDNSVIANKLINTLEESGAIAVPRAIERTLTDLNDSNDANAWQIELLSDSTNQQENFIDRSKYLDSLMARGLLFPERTFLEGTFGTKAEAEAHTDLAILILEQRHKWFTDLINYQVMPQYLLWNYGKDAIGTIVVQPSPIADNKKAFLKEIYMEILRKDAKAALEGINASEVRERLGLPILSLEEDDESTFNISETSNPFDTRQFGKEGGAPPTGSGEDGPGQQTNPPGKEGDSPGDTQRPFD